jgi:hypothetical protein
MQIASLHEMSWPAVQAFISQFIDLDATAKSTRALMRGRGVRDAASLLRLALAYAVNRLSLRGTTAWARASGVASLSDPSLLDRLRNAAPWLELIWQSLLQQRLSARSLPKLNRTVRLIDATSVSGPHSRGSEWRLHMDYRLLDGCFGAAMLSDGRLSEGLHHFSFQPGELVVADRGYAKATGLLKVVAEGADFLVRIGWRSLVLRRANGRPLDLLNLLKSLPRNRISEIRVHLAKNNRDRKAVATARLILAPLPEDKAAQARQRAERKAKRQGRGILAQGSIASGWMLLLTSLPANRASASELVSLYRLRWQIELAFKRLKSLLRIDELPARDPELVRCWLGANILAALLIDRMSQDLLESPPSAAR